MHPGVTVATRPLGCSEFLVSDFTWPLAQERTYL